MFNKKYLVAGIIFVSGMLWTTFAWDIIPWLNESYVNNFSQKWLFIISTSNNSIATNQIYPNPEKPYWWKMRNTFGMVWIKKKSAFLDIWVNFNLNTKKFIVIDNNWNLSYSAFNKSRLINFEGTVIANKTLISNLIGWTNPDNTVGYQCWTNVDNNKNTLCAWIYNAVGYFKVEPYAVENWSNWVKVVSLIKKSWFVWGLTNKSNYTQSWILKQRNGANNSYVYKLVIYKSSDNRYVSTIQTAWYLLPYNYQFKWDWFISTTWNNSNGEVWYFGNQVVWLAKISVDTIHWNTTVDELLNWTANGYVSAYPHSSLWSKQITDNWKTITKKYITLVDNGVLQDLDYTNARKVDVDWTYPLLTASNKWIEIEPNVENTIKAMNILSILNSMTEWMVSNSDARYVFMKPFGILDPQFKTKTNFEGKKINYISDLWIRNLNADNKLKIIFDTNKIKQWIQAWIKYGAFRTDYNNKWRMWYYQVAPIWYKLWQYVDNGKVISMQLDWTWALEKVYSPKYADITYIQLKDWTNWFVQNLSNNYILSHWSLWKFQLIWNFADRNLWLRDIYTNIWVKWWTVDNLHYIVNTVDWRFDKYNETDLRHINLQSTTTTPDVLSWKDLTYITPTNTNWWDLMIGSLSGDKVYLNTYVPDTKQLLNSNWEQLTSWSSILNFFKTDGNTTILIDADNLLWKKTN